MSRNNDSPPRKGTGAKVGGGIAVAVGAILAAIYANEGGHVDHPADPGGATRWGVTERVARGQGFTGDMRDFPKHCTANARICADAIYIKKYIKAPGFYPLIPIEPAVSAELVDTGVNMGPRRPSRWFQLALNELGANIAVDGRVGPRTIAAYREAQKRYGKVPVCVRILDRLDARQKAEYQRLVRVNPRLRVFYRGWINHRIGNVDRGECGRGWA